MDHGQELHFGTSAAVFRKSLVLGVIEPGLGGGFGGKLEHYNAAFPWVGAFQGQGVVVIG